MAQMAPGTSGVLQFKAALILTTLATSYYGAFFAFDTMLVTSGPMQMSRCSHTQRGYSLSLLKLSELIQMVQQCSFTTETHHSLCKRGLQQRCSNMG